MKEPNPLTKLFPIAVAAFGWIMHSLLVGIVIGAAFVAVTIASNLQVMSKEPEDWVSRIQTRKWILFAIFMSGIAATGAGVLNI